MFETYGLCAMRKVRRARNNLPSIIGLISYHDGKVGRNFSSKVSEKLSRACGLR